MYFGELCVRNKRLCWCISDSCPKCLKIILPSIDLYIKKQIEKGGLKEHKIRKTVRMEKLRGREEYTIKSYIEWEDEREEYNFKIHIMEM